MPTQSATDVNVNVSEVVDHLRIKGQFGPALREVIERKVTAQAAREKGFSVSDEELQQAADTFRQMNGLHDAEATRQWLEGRGLELEDLENYLEQNLLINKIKDDIQDNASQQEFLDSDVVQEHIRELAYGEWLEEQIENGS